MLAHRLSTQRACSQVPAFMQACVLDTLQAWINDGINPDGGVGEGGNWPGSHPHADGGDHGGGHGGDHPHHNLHHRHFHYNHQDLPPEQQQQGGPDGAGSNVHVEGGDGGLPVLGREVLAPVLGKEEIPVLGREELPVLGKDDPPPVLGREEIPVLGRDPQKGAPAGEDPATRGSGEKGGPSRWQRMQEAAMPGRFRHGR
eukprot:1157767-Pelagomonas_calceolata.AAC.14